MDTVEGLEEKIKELETVYAELLADDAGFVQLNKVWEEIKLLRNKLALLQSNNPRP